MKHWIDTIIDDIAKRCELTGRSTCVLNGGLSVSGLQHIGRLRGEIIINNVIAERLRNEYGFKVRQVLTLYTMDPWKGKEAQLRQFKNINEAKKFIGYPLEKVPDPKGCHKSWIEHYWKDFGDYLDNFIKINVEIITTSELYRSDKMRKFIKLTLTRRDEIIKVLNKYRSRNPYPSNYIPFEPICQKCGRIDSTETIRVNIDEEIVEYRCHNCGYVGTCSLSNGKLPWRIEWVGVWYCLEVDFEPYGKDHAMPGGSRDSANNLAMNVYGINPPLGIWYEWVGYVRNGKDVGDMGSSDFIGFTPKEWLEVAEPEVLRYHYVFHEPSKRLCLGLENVYQYVDAYDKAERLYYGIDKPSSAEEEYLELIIKSYMYAQLKPLPKEPPLQIPYLHLVALVQTLPEVEDESQLLDLCIRRLINTKVLKDRALDDYSLERLKSRLMRAKNWVQKYAPEHYRIKVINEVSEDIIKKLSEVQIEKLKLLHDMFSKIDNWCEDEIKEAMKRVPRESKEVERKFFEATYLIFFGRTYGPRIAPYLAMLGKEFTLSRIREVIARYG